MSPRTAVAAAIGLYNLVQNLVLSRRLYVPANLVASIALVALARRDGCSWDDLGLNPARYESVTRQGTAAAGAAVVLAAVLSHHRPTRRFLLDERAADQDLSLILYHTLVRFPLGTALFEEVAFRGVVEGVWRNDGATEDEAALASAILFALWHLIPTAQALAGNPAGDRLGQPRSRAGAVAAGSAITGLASLGFSWMRRRSGSLIAPWLAHTAISCAGYLAGVAVWRRRS